MIYGISISDFLNLGELAWKVYKDCRDSPGQYREMKTDAQRLANILSDLQDLVRGTRLKASKLDEILSHGQDIKCLLLQIEQLIQQYKGLSSQSRLTFDRLAWDRAETESIRSRLNVKVNVLNNVYLTIIASGQVTLQQAVDQIVTDMRSGRRDIDTVSSLTSEDDTSASEAAWQSVITDLQALGLSEQLVMENKDLIVEQIVRVVIEQNPLPPVSELDEADMDRVSVADRQASPENALCSDQTAQGPFYTPDNDCIATATQHGADADADADSWLLNLAYQWRLLPNARITTLLTSVMRFEGSWKNPRTYIFLRLLRGINDNLMGNRYLGVKDFRSIVIQAIEKYGALPKISDKNERLLLVSGAVWLGNACLQLRHVADASLAWTWAVVASLPDLKEPSDRQLTISITKQMRRLESLRVNPSLRASAYLNMTMWSPHIECWAEAQKREAYNEFVTWSRDVEPLLEQAYCLAISLEVERLSANSRDEVPSDHSEHNINVSMIREVSSKDFSKWKWRTDPFFSMEGTSEAANLGSSYTFNTPRDLETLDLLAFLRLDFLTIADMRTIFGPPGYKYINSTASDSGSKKIEIHPRYPVIYFKFPKTNAMRLTVDEPSFQEIFSPCILKAQACKLKVAGKNSQAWGLRFDLKVLSLRRPNKLDDESDKAIQCLWKELRSEAIRCLHSVIQDVRKSKDVQSLWSMRRHSVYR